MANLSINFAGIHAPNPFWLASGPPTNTSYQVMKAFDSGWGGAVWKTIGTDVSNICNRYGGFNYHKSRLVGMSNIEVISDRSRSQNLREMEEVKRRFPHHALIASLMVETHEEWLQIVSDVQNAGVDGIELNLSCPHGMCERGMGSAIGQNPGLVGTITGWAKEKANVPVIVKLTPNVTDITEQAREAKKWGANAISLINTISSITGVDIDRYIPYPSIDNKSSNGGYSGPAVKPIALNLVKNCAKDSEIGVPISGIGGIETWRDVVEFILLGASSVQVCTSVMHYGFAIVRQMISGLESYMNEHHFYSIAEFVGKALPNVTSWGELNTEYRVSASIDNTKCTGCNTCYQACEDGAYQAIALPADKNIKVPLILTEKCVGCGLCRLVCPVGDCISLERNL